MKRLIIRLFAVASVAILASACYKGGSDADDYSGAIFGAWVLDTKTITTETTVGGNSSKTNTVEDFSHEGCSLELNPGLTALARFGIKSYETSFSFDAESKRIEFPRGLSLSDNGKSLKLLGSYDVTLAGEDRMSLSQKAIGVTIGTLTADETTVYAFHRKADDSNGRQEKQY